MARIDDNGYLRGLLAKPAQLKSRNAFRHSDLIHRQIAYYEIYLKNRDKYPLPFSCYEIHHDDGERLNNSPRNLKLMIAQDHGDTHHIGFPVVPRIQLSLREFIQGVKEGEV
ncbi:hypothetical protein JXA85_00590 [Candidatus Woesearchaeota archaeon]|nr:hypothetical protein [Candidatus Woesearchaeota archaeon]